MDITNTEENKMFGIDIVELYNYDLEKAYNFTISNTDYLKNISIEEVKEIKFSCYKDIIILLRNGILLVNGKNRLENIKTMGFMSGLSIFAFSNDNIITCLTRKSEDTKFMNNNNYKYKKIIITPLEIVALTYEKEIKLFGSLLDTVVDYTRYTDVDDIGYVEENNDIVIIKNNEVYSLLVYHDYSNEMPDVVISGELKQNIYVKNVEDMNFIEEIAILEKN